MGVGGKRWGTGAGGSGRLGWLCGDRHHRICHWLVCCPLESRTKHPTQTPTHNRPLTSSSTSNPPALSLTALEERVYALLRRDAVAQARRERALGAVEGTCVGRALPFFLLVVVCGVVLVLDDLDVERFDWPTASHYYIRTPTPAKQRAWQRRRRRWHPPWGCCARWRGRRCSRGRRARAWAC